MNIDKVATANTFNGLSIPYEQRLIIGREFHSKYGSDVKKLKETNLKILQCLGSKKRNLVITKSGDVFVEDIKKQTSRKIDTNKGFLENFLKALDIASKLS